MSWQKVLFVLAVAVCVSTPAFATVVFSDDFEHGADWDLIGTPVVPVGSWALGGNTGNSMMAYWETTHGGLPDSSGFGGRKYGATIRGVPEVTDGIFNTVDALFAAQNSASTRVRFEADIWGQDGNGPNATACDLQLSFLSGATASNSVTLSGGSSTGSVMVGAVNTGATYSLGEWHHVTMDYVPTTSTFSLAIDGQTPLTGLAMTTTSAVDGFRFVQTSAGMDRWSAFDNVTITTSQVPEPSSIVLLVSALVGLVAYAWKIRR